MLRSSVAAPPETFFAYVCQSVDRMEHRSLGDRLAPFGMFVVQMINVAAIGGVLYLLGLLTVFSFGLQHWHPCYIYFIGVMYSIFGAFAYVGMQTLFVLVRNFIRPM